MRVLILLLLASASALAAAAPARHHHDPLTPAQIEEIREAAIDPAQRISIYIRIVREHAASLKSLLPRAQSAARSERLRGELVDFTDVLNELADNLDQYGDRHADLRKALKSLNESIPAWNNLLVSLPDQPAFHIERDEALASLKDLVAQAADLTASQDKYFAEHKDQTGQQRAEPHE